MATTSQKEAADKNTGNFIIRIANRFGGSIAEHMPGIASKMVEAGKLMPRFMSNLGWDDWCNKLFTEGYIDQDTADGLKPLARYRFPFGGLLMLLAMVGVKMADLKSVMEIYKLDRAYDLMGQTTPHPAPVDNLVRSMIIDPARATENRAELKKHGFSELQIDNIILSYYRTVDEGTLRTQFLRGIINNDRLYTRMRELGYTDERTGEIVQTWKMLPGPQDLFMMVAKEAFEPDIYLTLGLDEEFPSEQVKWLEDQGISEEWARKYWIAHWDQPSIGQGFEMLHRGVIGTGELDMLFRAVEIPSFWRDKLTKIAYNPYTRVDVRRMHDLGVLTDQELIESYMAQGYDSEKALKMANFTIKFNADHEVQLSRSAILESFREDLITHHEALSLLIEQDYSEDLASYYLELESFRRDKKIRDQQIDNLRERYLMNQITVTVARDELNKLELRGEKINTLIDTWTLDRYKYEAIPSHSELDGFLIKGIISEGEYNIFMARHGFSQTAISWYLQDMAGARSFGGRAPSRANIESWYKKGVIIESEYRQQMAALGYAPAHVELFFKAL